MPASAPRDPTYKPRPVVLHAHRFPIGAAPADIAPPISLRRTARAPVTQGGTQVGTSTSNGNSDHIEEVRRRDRERRLAKQQQQQADTARRRQVEVMVLEDGKVVDAAAATDSGKGKGKAKQVPQTEKPVEESDQGKQGPKRVDPPTATLPKMPVAEVKGLCESTTVAGATSSPDGKKKKKNKKKKPQIAKRDKARSSNHQSGLDLIHRRPERYEERSREGRTGGGHWRGGDRGRGSRGGYRGIAPPRGFTRHARNSLLSIGDLTGWVLVNDRAVELHKVKPKGPMTMSCYVCTPSVGIERTRPIEFAVGFRDDRPAAPDAPDLLIECVVDGVVVRHEQVVIRALRDGSETHGSNPRAARNPNSRFRTYTWRGRRESAAVIRPFVFSPLKLTEDEDIACSSESIIKALGTIKLRVFRGKVGTAAQAVGDEGYRGGIEAVEEMVFEESSAKVKGGGVSHHAGLGPARTERSTARSTFEMGFGDSDDKPYVTLEFVYRSRDVLELEGIIEPRALPSAPESSQSRTSSSNTSNRAPSMSAVPKDRTPSPALILAGRNSPAPRFSVTPAQRPVLAKKEEDSGAEEEDLGAEEEETKIQILEGKKAREARSERNLGTVILSSDDDDDYDDYDDSLSDRELKAQGRKVKGGSAAAAPPPKQSPATPVRTVSIPTGSKLVALPQSASSKPPREKDPSDSAAEDDEIAKLRAEIAALKRQNELAELRRERDELARAVGRGSGTGRDEGQQREKNKKKKAELDDEEEDEEVLGLLVGNSPGAKKDRTEREKKKLRTNELSRSSAAQAKGKEVEEVVLSDSSE